MFRLYKFLEPGGITLPHDILELIWESGFAKFVGCELQERIWDIDCEGIRLLICHYSVRLRLSGVGVRGRGEPITYHVIAQTLLNSGLLDLTQTTRTKSDITRKSRYLLRYTESVQMKVG